MLQHDSHIGRWARRALTVAVFLFLAHVATACSVSMTFTSPDDPRGYGLAIEGSSAYTSGFQMSYTHDGSSGFDSKQWGAGAFSYYFPLDCKRIGEWKYNAMVSCGDFQYDPGGQVVKQSFTVVVPDRPLVFTAEVLDPPQPAGNVLVTYEFNRTMRRPVITVPGNDAQFVANDRAGSFVVNLPPGRHRLLASWCFGGSNGEQFASLEVEVPMAALPPIRFELDETSNPDDRKVLIARHRADMPFISPRQTADGRLRIRAYAGVPGRRIHFRVIDPPDSAWYIPARERRPNDNAGGPSRLTLTEAVADASGYATTELLITDRHAGDNYQVEGSDDAAFSCGAACARTAVLTAWKRVYLEKKRMFRAGGEVVGIAPAGQNEVVVRRPNGVKFEPGDRIRLIHAPRLDGAGPRQFYAEDAIIAADGVTSVPQCNHCRRLTLVAPLGRSYGEDPSFAAIPLSDGVGILEDGFYERNEEYVTSTFDDAFVQYMNAPQQVTEIPYRRTLQNRLHFANKWFENSPVAANGVRAGDPNVKHVLAGSSAAGVPAQNPDLSTLGEVESAAKVTTLPSPNVCWTFVRTIEIAVGSGGQTSLSGLGLDPLRVNGENVVHELAHTWGVNYQHHPPNDLGHCVHDMASAAPSSTTKICAMNGTDHAQKGDGFVGFHWLSATDSEYMNIRRREEPIPAP